MTTFTTTWNAAYEATPTGGYDISLDWQVATLLKEAIRERAEVDHIWGDGSTEEGYHKAVHLKEQAAPTNLTDFGILYVDTSNVLRYITEGGSDHQIFHEGNVQTAAETTIADSGGHFGGSDAESALQDVGALLTKLSNLTDAEGAQLENIGTTTISASQWGYVGNLDQDLATIDSVQFADISISAAFPFILFTETDLADNNLRIAGFTGGWEFQQRTDAAATSATWMTLETSGDVSFDGSITATIAASNVTEISNLTAAEGAQLENIGTTTISAAQWGYIGNLNQNLRTTDAVTFATVDTGQGANELYAMNQAVRTSDSVTFASVTATIAASNVTEISNLTTAEGAQLEKIGTTTISAAQWGYLGGMDQDVGTGDSVTFSSVSATIAASNVTEISNLTASEGAQLENIGATTISATQWGVLGGLTASAAEINFLVDTQSTTIDLGGDFDANSDVVCQRIGDLVVLTAKGPLGHTFDSIADSTDGILPSAYRPSEHVEICYVHRVGKTGSLLISTSGQLSVFYTDGAGNANDEGTTGISFSIAYVITGNY